MKYNLSTVATHYTSGTDEHAALLKLGFKFRVLSSPWGENDLRVEGTPTIELNTLDDLRDLETLVGYSLVMDGSNITIYNDYME